MIALRQIDTAPARYLTGAVVAPLAQYQGCVRNGVTSHDFGRYGSAYRLSAI